MARIGILVRRGDGGLAEELLARFDAALSLLLSGDLGGGGGGGGEQPRGHIETTTTSDGRIETPYGPAPRALSDAIKAHWPRVVWTDAARVSYHESGWKHDAERNTLWRAGGVCGVQFYDPDLGQNVWTEDSVGYFQINVCSHGFDAEYWRDADNNARAGYDLYHSRGDKWTDWYLTAQKLGLL